MPNQPSPATKAAELIRSLAELAEESEPDGFELKRLEREAGKLLKIEALLSAVDRGVFTEERLREVVAIADEVLRASKIRTRHVEVHGDEHEPDSFLFECFVMASPEKAEDLNEALDAQIRDHPHLMDDPGLRFMPAFIGASADGSQPEAAT